jgi:hypothetical protein
MTLDPTSLAQLLHTRLRAQADVFAAVASHGTIVGTAREIALIEFFRGLVPRRFEVLSGAIATTIDGKLSKAASQLDVIVVDTFEYPTLLRTGDLAIAVPDSVRIVVEAKSDLEKGQTFFDALEQIGQARLLTGAGVLTALFCFGAPAKSNTLRDWLIDMLTHRIHLVEWAVLKPEQSAKDGTPRPKRYEKATKEVLLNVASTFSSANLPDLILADDGAIAIRSDQDGKTQYDFYKTKAKAPTVVALASKVLAHVSGNAAATSNGTQNGFKLLIDHYEAVLESASLTALDVTDLQPAS